MSINILCCFYHKVSDVCHLTSEKYPCTDLGDDYRDCVVRYIIYLISYIIYHISYIIHISYIVRYIILHSPYQYQNMVRIVILKIMVAMPMITIRFIFSFQNSTESQAIFCEWKNNLNKTVPGQQITLKHLN